MVGSHPGRGSRSKSLPQSKTKAAGITQRVSWIRINMANLLSVSVCYHSPNSVSSTVHGKSMDHYPEPVYLGLELWPSPLEDLGCALCKLCHSLVTQALCLRCARAIFCLTGRCSGADPGSDWRMDGPFVECSTCTIHLFPVLGS